MREVIQSWIHSTVLSFLSTLNIASSAMFIVSQLEMKMKKMEMPESADLHEKMTPAQGTQMHLNCTD